MSVLRETKRVHGDLEVSQLIHGHAATAEPEMPPCNLLVL